MNRTLALIVLAALPAAAVGQDNVDQPHLVPNTGGHTSIVSRLLFTPDGKQVISVSQDKTIRVWDVARGGSRVLRPPIGKGHEGQLYAAALSPDGKTLAVGGAPVGNGRLGYPIYLIDLSGGRIERSLLGHRNWIWGLAFSPDGKRLASASGDHMVGLWDLSAGVRERILVGHKDQVRDVVWSPDGKRLATASFDKTARLWSAETGESQVVLEGHEQELRCVAWSPDGKTIATGGQDQRLILWAPDGKVKQKLEKLGNWITSLSFTRSSKSLLYTRGSPVFRDRTVTFMTVETGKERLKFTQHNNSVFAGAISPDMNTAATAGGDSHEIYLWNTDDARVLSRLSGPARSVVSAAWKHDGISVAWGSTRKDDPIKALNPLERSFRLVDLEFAETPDASYEQRKVERAGLKLEPIGVAGVAVKRGSKTLTTLRLNDRDRLRCFTFLDGDRVAIGSTNNLDIFDVPTGQRLRTLVGHTDEVWAVAPAPNRHWLLSASTDQTLRLWDTQAAPVRELAGLGFHFKIEGSLPVLTAVTPNSPAAQDGRLRVGDRLLAIAEAKSEFVELKDRTQAEVIATIGGPVNSVVRLKVLPEGKDEPVEYVLQRGYLSLVRSEPFLSLFFAGNDWVAWTEEGYYAASPGGEKLMGWHINNGKDQMGTFCPVERFAKALYRPDIISRLVETGSVERAMALADLVRGKKSERVEIAQVLPPRVRITSPDTSSLELKEGEFELTAEAQMTGDHPIRAMRLLLDGRPYKGLEAIRRFEDKGLKEAKASWKVRVNPGRHRLVVQADSDVSQGDSSGVEVNYVIGTPPRGRLFVLAVGISTYADDSLRLFYSAKDAKAIVQRLQEKSRPVPYQEIKVRLLTDKEATRAAILKELDDLQKQMLPEDSAWVFFSGHGERDSEGGLYLLPVDVDVAKLKDTCVSGEELRTALVNIQGQVLLVLDACHSGAAGASSFFTTSVSDELARELGRDENGVIVMCSSMARQTSLEDNENRQSTFTLALLEGLVGKGPRGLDGIVYQHHLDSYVIDRVRQLTKGRQTPTTAKPGNLPPFPVSKP
jgi:WD40 repeat protein